MLVEQVGHLPTGGNMSNSSSSSSGIGFTGLLAIVFITLKLTHYIDWSWWWVLSPILIPISIFLLIIAGFFCFVIYKAYRPRKIRQTNNLNQNGRGRAW